MHYIINSNISLMPWISWHEYEILGKLKTLLYEQNAHTYYLLYDVSAEAWHDLMLGKPCDKKAISALKQLIDDGILTLSYGLCDESVCTIEKYEKIQDVFLEEIKEEGYVFDAHWDITNRCNERCIHCYNNNAHNNLRNINANELSFEDAIKMVDELHNIGVFRIVLSGGEVLTKDHFLLLCKYIRQRNMQLIVYTNGLAFSDSLLEEFVKLYPSTVCISVYGDTGMVHDKITRIDGSYNKVMKALSFFKERQVETHVKNTLLTENYPHWRDTLLKGKSIASKSMTNCTIYPSMDSGKLSRYALNESQLVELAKDKDSPIYFKRTIRGSCNIFKRPNETPCYNITNNIYVNPSGVVYLCIAFPCVIASLKKGNIRDLKRRPNSKSVSGFNCDFSQLSGTARLDNWRSLKISDLKECGHHVYCMFCIDVCPGDAYLLTGDLLKAPENHCVIAKARYEAYRISTTERHVNTITR